jgi:hypothetical protein
MYGMIIAYWSPLDIVYRHVSDPTSVLGFIVRFVESIDVSVALCEAFEKGARLQPSVPAAPYIAAMATALGGSIFRWFERKGRHVPVLTEWCRPSGSIQKATVYIAAYAILRKHLGVRVARLCVCTFRLLVDMLAVLRGNELGSGSDPATDLCEAILACMNRLKVCLQLGPMPPPAPQAQLSVAATPRPNLLTDKSKWLPQMTLDEKKEVKRNRGRAPTIRVVHGNDLWLLYKSEPTAFS